MAIKSVVKNPDPRLRNVCVPVLVASSVRALYTDLKETLEAQNAAGIAANQIGDNRRVFIVDPVVAGLGVMDPPVCFINPHIIEERDPEIGPEGCLSLPGETKAVERSAYVKVRAMNLKGELFEVEARGLYARCILHETDHLNGILMTDY